MKTFEAPMKAQWERKEYLKNKKDLADLEGRAHTPFIFCSHCRKEIKEATINVVDFGRKVACKTCYSKKWEKIRNRIAKLPVPAALAEDYEQPEDSEEYKQQIEQDKKDVAAIQQKCLDQIADATGTPPIVKLC